MLPAVVFIDATAISPKFILDLLPTLKVVLMNPKSATEDFGDRYEKWIHSIYIVLRLSYRVLFLEDLLSGSPIFEGNTTKGASGAAIWHTSGIFPRISK